MTAVVWRVFIIRVLCGRWFRVGDVVSVGYAIAHPRLNPVGILPPGSRPSDVHSDTATVVVDVDAMTCEACEAETQARHIARGKRSATPGIHHPHHPASAEDANFSTALQPRSGCNLNNPMLTISEAQSATWG